MREWWMSLPEVIRILGLAAPIILVLLWFVLGAMGRAGDIDPLGPFDDKKGDELK